MARVTNHRAPAWLAVAMLLAQSFQPVRAQAPVMAPEQPMWVNPGPMMQAGPDGAVNLDQMMGGPAPYGGSPYYAGQPVMAPPAQAYAPYNTYPAQPFAAQP